MGEHRYGPGGGALPTRPDDKIARERQRIVTAGARPIDDTNHQRAWRRMLKRAMTKKRRQHDSEALPFVDDLVGLGPCAVCGHDPACGFSSIVKGDGPELWYCHTDDHSCYEIAQ